MATLVKALPGQGICPNCWHKSQLVAVKKNGGWRIVEQCYCQHILNDLPWPFEEGFEEVSVKDLQEAGIADVTDKDREDEEDKLFAEELLEEEETAYNKEVAHGWEQQYY